MKHIGNEQLSLFGRSTMFIGRLPILFNDLQTLFSHLPITTKQYYNTNFSFRYTILNLIKNEYFYMQLFDLFCSLGSSQDFILFYCSILYVKYFDLRYCLCFTS